MQPNNSESSAIVTANNLSTARISAWHDAEAQRQEHARELSKMQHKHETTMLLERLKFCFLTTPILTDGPAVPTFEEDFRAFKHMTDALAAKQANISSIQHKVCQQHLDLARLVHKVVHGLQQVLTAAQARFDYHVKRINALCKIRQEARTEYLDRLSRAKVRYEEKTQVVRQERAEQFEKQLIDPDTLLNRDLLDRRRARMYQYLKLEKVFNNYMTS